MQFAAFVSGLFEKLALGGIRIEPPSSRSTMPPGISRVMSAMPWRNCSIMITLPSSVIGMTLTQLEGLMIKNEWVSSAFCPEGLLAQAWPSRLERCLCTEKTRQSATISDRKGAPQSDRWCEPQAGAAASASSSLFICLL